MAVEPGMFLFEVVVENVKTLSESRQFVIRSDFADVFSLELKDPKQMHIVIPDPPPLPPEPPGKKKGKKPPKPKKGKKGKKGVIELPPPEPVIQSGQSVLFTSTPEFLIQTMKKFPLEITLWSKEDNLVLIGSNSIPWDPIFPKYLEKICNCEDPEPTTLSEGYNIFEEGRAGRLAQVQLQIKLSFLKDKITMSFRTLSEDLQSRKYLYTGINSKTTSYICNMKTTDEIFIENSNKIENKYVEDNPKPKKIVFADYKNAPGANLTFFNEDTFCCMSHADKPPESIYKSPETLPDIDFIIDYVRKIIVSCNDNMRMLTPRTTLIPRIKATDMDRLCYCKETKWPKGEIAKRFKKEAQSEPCAMCINAGMKPTSIQGTTFDIANIRGPCGRADCRIARDMRAYIENLAEEDMQEIKLDDIIGPCGSKTCLLATKIQEFIRREGTFSSGANVKGLQTQCSCITKMQDALVNKGDCQVECEHSCKSSTESDANCGGSACPSDKKEQHYQVYYFTVEYNFAKNPKSGSSSAMTMKTDDTGKPSKNCDERCPSMKNSRATSCSTNTCSSHFNKSIPGEDHVPKTCSYPECPKKNNNDYPPSPPDSNVEIKIKDIHNMCCVETCDIANTVKEFVVEGFMKKNERSPFLDEDLCYCDCVCTLKFTKKTTYCPVCGGYECLGEDLKNQPDFAMPYPCPVYHKLYDKKYIKVQSPWPEENQESKKIDAVSVKSGKSVASRNVAPEVDRFASDKETPKKKANVKSKETVKIKEKKSPKEKKVQKQVGKPTTNSEGKKGPPQMETWCSP